MCQNCKFKSIYWIFLFKDTNSNSNTFSWLIFLIFHVKIANSSQFTGFFLSKTQIQIYFLDFSWYITNSDISYYFSCQNFNLNECDGFFLSKIPVFYIWHEVFSWIFLFLDFDLQPFHDFFWFLLLTINIFSIFSSVCLLF